MEMELFPRMIPGKSRRVRRKKSIIMLCAVLVALVASFVAYYIVTQNRAAREIAAQLAAEVLRCDADILRVEIGAGEGGVLAPHFA